MLCAHYIAIIIPGVKNVPSRSTAMIIVFEASYDSLGLEKGLYILRFEISC